MTLSIANQIVNEENCNKESDDLECVEGEGHILVANTPPDNNKQRNQEKRNLHGRSDSNTNGQIHFVLDSNGNGSRMLACIPNDREKDQADELFTDNVF